MEETAYSGATKSIERPLTNQTQQQNEKITLLYQPFGQLQFELDRTGGPVAQKKLISHQTAHLRTLIEPDSPLPFVRQCEGLGLPRSSCYHQPIGENAQNLQLMRLLDEQYFLTPFFGVGQFTNWLPEKGHAVNPKRIGRLLRLLDLQAICPGPDTSKPGTGAAHKACSYLFSSLTVSHVGHVYGTDITYIPLKRGFLYLTAFRDWFSRYVLAWKLSNSLASFCLIALERACSLRKPQIINTDQGVA